MPKKGKSGPHCWGRGGLTQFAQQLESAVTAPPLVCYVVWSLELAFITSMFKTALNKNIIPHTWKLANIVPIPKPNKDTYKGTSYRPISLLSVIAKTLEKSLFPYITANMPITPLQHVYKPQHSTVTALHTLTK